MQYHPRDHRLDRARIVHMYVHVQYVHNNINECK